MPRVSLMFLLMGICACMNGQSSYRTGILPQVNLTLAIGKAWKAASKIESRQIITSGTFGQNDQADYRYERTDIALLMSRKSGIGHTFSAGYMIRIRNRELIHRIIQQYAFVNQFSGWRLGHRFAADQTISRLEAPIYRLRYRITFDLPLNGQKADAKEAYLKINHEYLYIFGHEISDMETRLVPALGYLISDRNKIEFGLNYRLEGVFMKILRHNFWMYFSWYRSL